MIVFLDFEASSLGDDSYPIEAGWVTEDGVGEGHLIRPATGWTDWSDASERVHGVSRDRLETEGSAVEVVAHRVHQVLGADGVVIASDAARWEQF